MLTVLRCRSHPINRRNPIESPFFSLPLVTVAVSKDFGSNEAFFRAPLLGVVARRWLCWCHPYNLTGEVHGSAQ